MSKYTPGPWRIAENEWNATPDEPWTDAIKIEGDVNTNWVVPPIVCVTYRGQHNIANARLIAAAPKLLSTIKTTIAILNEVREEWDKASNGARAGKLLIALCGGCPGYRADIDAIHASIAEAEGAAPSTHEN